MRLKKIELGGFKSFLERTKLVFQPGITAIVGPNGCGKSNVVDAVLWVMGEQSAKNLRGGLMEDVIFNGTENREPIGMAEVNLVLDNSSGTGPAQFASHSEIMVTRRLHRTGESEYLINKTPCRLRDILELFMDTGVGTRAYSIIKQGQIDRITSAKPEDLRTFIEEAAGIAKYKSRKRSAERKMESTKDNLTRLDDILSEISSRLDSLNRQAKKAQRYKAYKEELRDLDLALASHKLAELQSELDRKESKLRAGKDREMELANDIETREAGLETARANLLELEKEIDELSQNHFRAQSEAQETENQIEMLTRRIESITEMRDRSEAEIKEITVQIETIEAELAAMEDSRKALTMEVASNDADLETRATELVETRERMETIRRSHEDALSQQAALRASISAVKQAVEERREQLENFEARLAEKKIAKTVLLEEIEKLKQLSFDFTRNLDDLIRAREALEGELADETARLEGLKDEFLEKEVRLEALRTEFNQRLSRFDSLRELEANLEGYNEGVRSIMLQKQDKKGIYGLVADIVNTTYEYEKALEAVLGERLQYIIVKSHTEGVEAIDYLKTQSAGRGTFIPIEVQAPGGESMYGSGPLPEVYNDRIVGNLIDLVEVEPEYNRVISFLLGDVVVVPDISTAIDIWRSNGHRKMLVTLDGEVLDPVGVLSGGASIGTGILKKRRDIRELENEVDRLKTQVETASADCAVIEEKIAQTKEHIEETKSGHHKREMEILHHEKELERYTGDTERIHSNLNELAESEAALVRDAEKCARRIAELDETYRSKEFRLADLAQVVEKGTETLKVFGEEIATREETLTNLRIDHATSREKLETLERRYAELTSRKDELTDNRRNKMSEIAQGAEETGQLEREIEDLRKKLDALHTRRMDLEDNLSKKRDLHEKSLAAQTEQVETLKERRGDLEEVRRSLGELYVACNECTLKIEHLVSDMDDKYAVDILEIGPRPIEESAIIDEKNERRTRLRNLIDRMGEVNLTAIKEYEELKERYDFLSGQREDLLKSIDDLQTVIKKINRTSRKRFAETFEQVNEHFRKIFPRLFGGGRASIILEDHPDILEAGVEIVVQPPGKKLQKMTLLSGGEKALAAVALIFSLFLVKPSPFCILDEVDSPLDDVNIDRFNDLVRELSRTSQFVIITHNKRTMELADTLYGVTMEQKGISKLVSVRLADTQPNGQEAA